MKYLKSVAAVIVAAALLGLGTASVASAEVGPVRPTIVTCGVTMQFFNTGRVWDIRGASTDDHTPIQMYGWNAGWNQKFELCSGDGIIGYFIFNPGSGKCVDVAGASLADHAAIQLYPCTENANQQFQLVHPTAFGWGIQSVNSGKCIDIPNADPSDGVALQQYTCTGQLNQDFALYQVS
jgi:hypothetical protein